MTFFRKFRQAVTWQPGRALLALYWHLTRRRVRADNLLRSIAITAPFAYQAWLQENEDNPATLATKAAAIADWDYRPAITVIGSPAARAQLEQDLAEQCYRSWTWADVPPEGLTAAFVARLGGDHVLHIADGTRLPPAALFRLAEAIRAAPAAAALYGDHDYLAANGERQQPWLKPEWNREQYLAQDYISASCALGLSALRAATARHPSALACGWSALVAAVVTPADAAVVHVPKITAHLPLPVLPDSEGARLPILTALLADEGAEVVGGLQGTLHVLWPLDRAAAPLVSIVIPTRNRVDLLETCIGSLRRLTDYSAFELLVIDNGSTDPATLRYLAALESEGTAQVIRDPAPYNFAQLNNRAVRQTRGTVLCLLNNDTEITHPSWLDELVRQAVRPSVGAVGAKLLYPDGRLQHAGVVIGMGQAAGHAHRFEPDDAPGYFLQPHLARYASAVTGACLAVEKAKFAAVGGFDEVHFAVAYNDVDLCLRLQAAGWDTVYTPYAMLIHHESVSRGDDLTPQHSPRYFRELAALQQRWGTIDAVDRYHHPDLDRAGERFTLRF